MNILVTGCAGFIGSSLVDKLIEIPENKIIGIDNFDGYYSSDIKEKNMNKFINDPNFVFFKEDIRNTAAMLEIFRAFKVDAVIHLAAKAGVRASFEYPLEYESVNIGGTLNILNCMAQLGIKKIVFASSSSVYGNCKEEIFTENIQNLEPLSPYAQTKKTCEEFIKIYSREYDINALCLRFFTVFGPKQRPDLAINKFSQKINKGEPIDIYGDGLTYRDYTYIDDVTEGIISAIHYDKTPYEIINLGSQNPIKLNELVYYIEAELCKKAIVNHLPMQRGDVDKTYADITKAKQILNYSPKLTFQQGLHIFIKQLFDIETV